MRQNKHILFILLFYTTTNLYAQTGLELVNKMLANGAEIKSLKYEMRMKERIREKYAVAKNLFKVQVSPFKVYLKQDYPLTNMEILYVDGINNNQALVHPCGFPWANVNLDINGTHMRKNLHHPITDSGFHYVFSIVKYLLDKYKLSAEKIVSLDGVITWKGTLCHKITLTNPFFKYYDYIVKPGETIFSIAAKNKINDYMIMDKNPALESFDDCKPGMKIKLPNDYASKMEIWLDQKAMLPLIMRIYDDTGLYEEYEFINIVVNHKFQAIEFSTKYHEYNF